jgi:colicin import membrane protein
VRFSLPTSLLLHGGLLAWAFMGLQQPKPFKPAEPEPVEVAIITEDGLTRLRQGDRNSKNLETAPAKEVSPSKAVREAPKAKPPEPAPPPPPPPEPAKVEPPPPEPPKAAEVPPPKPPEPQKDVIAALALKAEAEALARAEAERKAAEEKKRQEALKKKQEDERKRREALKKKQEEDRKRLAEIRRRQEAAKKKEESFEDAMQKALRDNDPRKRAAQPSGGQVASASNVKGPQAGAPEGRDTRLTASEASLLGSMMKRQVARCWNISAGADGIDKIRIEVEVRLSPDGRIQGQPRVVSRGTGPLYADMADSAMRALIQCQQPNGYDLPKHLYKGGWDHMIVEFDPGRMF